MIVKTCAECPFFRLTPLLGGITMLVGGDPKGGYCNYDRTRQEVVVPKFGLPPGPARDENNDRARALMRVGDKYEIPNGCPLRDGDVTVSLGS